MSNNAIVTSKWTQYNLKNRPQADKRAEVVCVICHAKKIKCDLQGRRRNGLSECSFCSKSGRNCQPRFPKRRTRRAESSGNTDGPASSVDAFTDLSNNDLSGVLPITPVSHDEMARLPSDSNNDSSLSMTADDPGFGTGRTKPRSRPGSSASHGQGIQTTFQVARQAPISGKAPAKEDDQERRTSYVTETHSGGVDTGFVQVYGREIREDAHNQALKAQPRLLPANTDSQVSTELLNIYGETYFEDCYAMCPVLDRETLYEELYRSPLLQNALAILGSHVRPPMLPHDGPAAHYDRARRMFYEDEEPDTLVCLRAILLFNWWAPRSTAMVHRHTTWWWTSVVIRHAQQMGMHRPEPAEFNTPSGRLSRRVWWTAFARERLTALCQSKPAIIDPSDCSVPEPSLDDFPPESRDDPKATIWVYWVRLCGVIGRLAQMLSRSSASGTAAGSDGVSNHVAEELIAWVRSLPPQISVSLNTRFVSSFDKDAYQLHIVYLVAIIVLNLRRTPEPGTLPLVLPPAVLAASCLARIFKGILAKGDTRFLMPITSWYCGISYITLLAASQDPTLREAVKADMELVEMMCDQLRRMWASANVIYLGFERLRVSAESECSMSDYQPSAMASVAATINDFSNNGVDQLASSTGSHDWIDYFPFASNETSKTAEILLELRQSDNLNSVTWDPALLDLDGLLNYTDFTLDNEFLDGLGDLT